MDGNFVAAYSKAFVCLMPRKWFFIELQFYLDGHKTNKSPPHHHNIIHIHDDVCGIDIIYGKFPTI
jgi:hypothetical protein